MEQSPKLHPREIDSAFSGHKLLLLGDSIGTLEILRYAKSRGAYVIVTDNVADQSSSTKQLADEVWTVSTSNIVEIAELARAAGATGVLAGVSEFNLLSAIRVSEQVGLRFFCNETQWNSVANKDEFRLLCERHRVPHPDTFYVGNDPSEIELDSLKFPIVVKPVDGSASQGVSICTSPSDVSSALENAIENSPSGRVLVESFATGVEFTAHYSVVNGSVALSSLDDRYPVTFGDSAMTSLPGARVYPSLMTEAYLRTVDKGIQRLFSSLGLENAVLFVQGIFDESTGSFSIFEAGLRTAAELPSRFLRKIVGLDHIELLVDQVLLGHPTRYDQAFEDPFLGGKTCAIYSYVTAGGEIGHIEGINNSLYEIDGLLDHEVRYSPGQVAPHGATLRQILARFIVATESRSSLADVITRVNNSVNVLSATGTDMAVKMQPRRVLSLSRE